MKTDLELRISRRTLSILTLRAVVALTLTLGAYSTLHSKLRLSPTSASWLGSSEAWAAGLPNVFSEAVVREVILNSKPGAKILSDVTATSLEYATAATYRSFLQRLEWQQNKALTERLAEEFTVLEREFAELRTKNGKNPKLETGEVLSREERSLIEAFAERSLKGNAIENLLLESRTFFEIPKGKSNFQKTREEFISDGKRTIPKEPEVPVLPTELEKLAGPNSELPDLSILEAGFKSKLVERFRLYGKFFKTFMLSEAQAKRMFGLAGKKFTEADLVLVRKLNRLLDVLNEYTRMRLIVKSFAQERPMLYERLNAETTEATQQYLDGILSEVDYLEIRKIAAEKLRLNGIVHEAEKRMLQIVHRCKELGGGVFAGTKNKSMIDIAEDNLRQIQAKSKTQETILKEAITKENEVAQALKNAKNPEEKKRIAQAYKESKRTRIKEEADLDLWRKREHAEAENLKKMYIDFVEAYDSLSLFLNIRRGQIHGEEVRAFDLPDAFVPSMNEVQIWKDFYDRALYNSTHELVVHESQAFFQAQIGGTRKFIREMNEMTGKYFGKRFTESELGQEFLEYNRHVASATLIRIGKLLGLTLPPTIGTYHAETLWKFLFTDEAEEKLKKEQARKEALEKRRAQREDRMREDSPREDIETTEPSRSDETVGHNPPPFRRTAPATERPSDEPQ